MTDSIWFVVFLGAIATFMWRFAGVAIAKFVNSDGMLMVYVNAAAHAMVAGVMSIILVYPIGSLATTSLDYRLTGFGLALVIMVLFRKLGIAIVTGMMSFAVLESGLLF